MTEPIYYFTIRKNRGGSEVNKYDTFKIRKNRGGSWVNKYDTRKILDPDKIYKTTRSDFDVDYLSKVEVLIAIGKGAVIEEL